MIVPIGAAYGWVHIGGGAGRGLGPPGSLISTESSLTCVESERFDNLNFVHSKSSFSKLSCQIFRGTY